MFMLLCTVHDIITVVCNGAICSSGQKIGVQTICPESMSLNPWTFFRGIVAHNMKRRISLFLKEKTFLQLSFFDIGDIFIAKGLMSVYRQYFQLWWANLTVKQSSLFHPYGTGTDNLISYLCLHYKCTSGPYLVQSVTTVGHGYVSIVQILKRFPLLENINGLRRVSSSHRNGLPGLPCFQGTLPMLIHGEPIPLPNLEVELFSPRALCIDIIEPLSCYTLQY